MKLTWTHALLLCACLILVIITQQKSVTSAKSYENYELGSDDSSAQLLWRRRRRRRRRRGLFKRIKKGIKKVGKGIKKAAKKVKKAAKKVKKALKRKKVDYNGAITKLHSQAANGRKSAIALLLSWNCYHDKSSTSVPPSFRLLKRYSRKHKSVSVYVSDKQKILAVSHRGTVMSSLKDVSTNIKLKRIKLKWRNTRIRVHKGFYKEYEYAQGSYWPYIVKYVQQKGYKLLLTGHSQGGALAEINALDMAVNQGVKADYLISFGAPRVGDSQFGSQLRKHISYIKRYVSTYKNFRGKRKSEVVTRVPSKRKFKHSVGSTKLSCPVKRCVACIIASFKCHTIKNYAFGLANHR